MFFAGVYEKFAFVTSPVVFGKRAITSFVRAVFVRIITSTVITSVSAHINAVQNMRKTDQFQYQ
jgi:hypothetical protein